MASEKEIEAAAWFFCPHNGITPGRNRICGAPCGSCKHKGRGALEAAEYARWEPRWRHKKRGTIYEEVGPATLQTDGLLGDNTVLLVYRDENGKMWARTPPEFHDGRFEALPSPPEERKD